MMTMEVLQKKKQINESRDILIKKGVSIIDNPLSTILRRVGLLGGVKVGDKVKSWDVLSTIKFLEENIKKDSKVLDIGCYASEILVSLNKLGFKDLTGIDLNPDLNKMPCQEAVRYVVDDFMNTKFENASFDAITSISVIEHGFNSKKLLTEMSRLLKPGGYLIASFDYWPDKIDTSEVKFFGMDWLIFSKDEVLTFVNEAAEYGLFPVGELNYEAKDRVISCSDQDYTFAWMVLKKSS